MVAYVTILHRPSLLASIGLDLIEQIKTNYKSENKMHSEFHIKNLFDI